MPAPRQSVPVSRASFSLGVPACLFLVPYLRRFVFLLACVVTVCAIATCARATTKKPKKISATQAKPAQGNSSDQPVPVSTPFCDAYLPYEFEANANGGRIVQQFPSPALTYPVTAQSLQDFLSHANVDTFIDSFIQKKWTTLDPVAPDGSLHDPGYPLLGDPQKHLYANGNDLSRILTRLSYNIDPTLVPASLCLGSPAVPSKGTHPDIGLGSRNGYYLVHIVRWKRSDGHYVTSSSDWYLFNTSDGKAAHRQVPFRFHPVVTGDLRIFGSNKVLFLAVHLGPSEDPDFAKDVSISYKLSAKNIEPANIQDLKALIGVVTGSSQSVQNAESASAQGIATRNNYKQFLTASLQRTNAGFYGAAKLTNLQRLPVQITAAMQAKLPKANSDLPDEDPYKSDMSAQALASASGQGQANPANSSNGAGGAQGSTNGTGSATTGSTTSGSQKPPAQSTKSCSTTDDNGTCLENVVVQNEGLYLWDVSIGVPFNGVKQLQYNYGSNGQVTPQTVSKASAYGFVVLSPWKEDIVSPPSLGIPHLMAGLPLKGKVFDAPFFGAGETFNASKLPRIGSGLAKVIPISIRFYAGMVYNKQFGPATTSGVEPPSHRVTKLQYGIEFSVKDIASKLSGKSSASSKPGTSSAK